MSGTTEGGRKSSESGRGDPQKESPTAIERDLKGVHYPASKDELLRQAKNNGAPEDALYVLNKFQKKKYNTNLDISKEVSHV
jgi:hypothetical protein